jgi:hypothetical protein
MPTLNREQRNEPAAVTTPYVALVMVDRYEDIKDRNPLISEKQRLSHPHLLTKFLPQGGIATHSRYSMNRNAMHAK